jgi:hypothetical protein
MNIPKNTVIKYLRDNKGYPRGVIVAVRRPDGEVSIDYSLCKKGDRFTKAMALEIAIGRAMKGKEDLSRTLPHSLVKEMNRFNERAEKYYRTNREEIYTW